MTASSTKTIGLALALALAGCPLLAETPLSAAIFARLDTNADQSISPAEMAAARAKMFKHIDGDQDGAITSAEIAATRAEIQDRATAAGALFANRAKRLDADRDGILSLEEFTAPPPGLAVIDHDDDGALSLPEFSKLAVLIAPGLK